jgi:hypothetical protein
MVTVLERVHGETRRRLSMEAERLIRRAWVMANGREDVFIAEAVAIASAARNAVVGEVDAYLAAYLSSQGVRSRPLGLDPAAYARPVAPERQWSRPGTQMRLRLDKGATFTEAFAYAGHAAAGMLATDMQMASVRASRDVMMQIPQVSAWARVLGSGGKSGENCGLCIVASTRVYRKGDLMPIHDSCTCEVKPLLDSQVPKSGPIAADNLDAVHAGLADIDGQYSQRYDLMKVRIDAGSLPRPAVAPHGEIGPYLYPAGQKSPALSSSQRTRYRDYLGGADQTGDAAGLMSSLADALGDSQS